MSESLKTVRLAMALSTMAPLFLLWAVRGTSLVPELPFIIFCVAMAVLPSTFLLLRFSIAKRSNDKRKVVVGMAYEQQDHVLIYLFSVLVPLYTQDIATLVAVPVVIFLFWHLSLHYLNPVVAALGYRVFDVCSPIDSNPLTGRAQYVVITRYDKFSPGETINAYRLSDMVYIEV